MWDERYADDEFVYGTDPNDFIRENAHYIQEDPVLCMAAGEGRNAVWLAEQGFDVLAVDSSKMGLAKARKMAEQQGVELRTETADLSDWEFPTDHFGAITSVFFHTTPLVRKRVHREVVRALKPGGVLLLEAYTPDQLGGKGGPPKAELMMTLEQLREQLGELEILHGEELRRQVNEGRFHAGEGAVVQIIARKR